MNRRIISGLLALLLALSLSAPAFAQEEQEERVIHIKTEQDLKELAADCALDSFSLGLTVELDNDIALSEAFSPIPSFSGEFNGNNHTISNLTLATDGSHQGFFRYLEEGAYVHSLRLSGSIAPEGSRCQVGGIAGVNNGEISFCSFKGRVSGLNYVGGIAGVNNGSITGCSFSGTAEGKRFTGGIAGYNSTDASITLCTNTASINTEISEGGISVDSLNITNALKTLNLVSVQDEDIVSDSGGIAGFSQGAISYCTNRGNAGYSHYGYNVGGIAGRQSGSIYRCENSGEILGRKDVGGICGQMEPYLIISDRQTIADAISALGGATAYALSNLGAGSDELRQAMDSVNGTASEVFDYITGYDSETGETDPSSIEWGEDEQLHEYLNSISSDMGIINANLNETIAGAAGDFANVNVCAQAVLNLLASALSGNMTSEFYEDVTDSTATSGSRGCVYGCSNAGAVEGDENVGGIAGSMAVELEFDMEGTLLDAFRESTSGTIETVKYLSSCLCSSNVNEGAADAKKKCCGGICGYQDAGIINLCENYGAVSAGDSLAGGIAGRSNASIKSCSAMSKILAGEYCGGIAGYGTELESNYSLVDMEGATAAFGAIAGYVSEIDEEKISGNFYVGSWGALDGISYLGIAEPMEFSEFSRLEGLPEEMKQLKLTFRAEGKTVKEVYFTYGGEISEAEIPEVPQKAGCSGSWQEFERSGLCFSRFVEAEYSPFVTAVETEELREGKNLPLALACGDFGSECSLKLEKWQLPVEGAAECWTVELSGGSPGEELQLRFLVPEGYEVSETKIYRINEDCSLEKLETEEKGSYISFDASGESFSFAVFCSHTDYTPLYVCGGVAVLLAAALLLAEGKKKTEKKGEEACETEA